MNNMRIRSYSIRRQYDFCRIFGLLTGKKSIRRKHLVGIHGLCTTVLTWRDLRGCFRIRPEDIAVDICNQKLSVSCDCLTSGNVRIREAYQNTNQPDQGTQNPTPPYEKCGFGPQVMLSPYDCGPTETAQSESRGHQNGRVLSRMFAGQAFRI